MIDHLMTFASEAAAKADPVVGQYYTAPGPNGPGGWRGDCCIPNVFVWQPSADTTVTDPSTGFVSTVHHPFDTNWRVIIARLSADPALTALASCHLVTDRDAAAVGQPFVVQSVMTQAQLNTLALSPTFAGSAYPFGDAH